MKTLNEKQKADINEMLCDKLGVDMIDITEDALFANSLGADSLDHVEIMMETERLFNCIISDDEAEDVKTVGDLYNVVAGRL